MKAGFIGLGAMGAPMARNLHRAGLLELVWNRTPSVATALAAELGCARAEDIGALVRAVEAVLLCVSADADVLGVLEAIEPHLRAGQLVIDCSTVSADTARAAARRVAAHGAAFLDAPVSGGVEGARAGTLAIMAGGDEAALARALPLLNALGRTVTHFGPSGAGQAAKATNQIMGAGINRAVAEAMAFAAAQQLPLQKIIATLGRGASANWYLENRAPNMLRDSYPPGFRVALHAKDLRICRDMARAAGASLPVIEETLSDYARLIEQGHADEDVSCIYRLKAALFAATPPA